MLCISSDLFWFHWIFPDSRRVCRTYCVFSWKILEFVVFWDCQNVCHDFLKEAFQHKFSRMKHSLERFICFSLKFPLALHFCILLKMSFSLEVCWRISGNLAKILRKFTIYGVCVKWFPCSKAFTRDFQEKLFRTKSWENKS